MDDNVELTGWHGSKNSKVLAEFMKYCYDHPEMRFWQALRNWSGSFYILAAKEIVSGHDKVRVGTYDTYYEEGK